MTEKQKQDLHTLQRNKELERAVEEANLMLPALKSLADVAEQDEKIQIRKKRGYQTILKLQDNHVGVGPRCKLFGKNCHDHSKSTIIRKKKHTEYVGSGSYRCFRREIPGLGTNKVSRNTAQPALK